jgi:uncharacterized protein (UPF0276 family)
MMTTQHHSKTKGFKGLPVLGVGLGLRHPLLSETLKATDLIDWLEITPENYMGKGGRSRHYLEQAQDVYPLIPHGVSLSIGSVDPWDEDYLKHFKTLLKRIEPAWFSDHLCFSGVQGRYFNDLLPLPRTREAVDHVVKRIQFVQNRFERPFLIENISFYVDYPHNELTEAQFVSEILEQADCGLLLDVNNVFVNGHNRKENPMDFLQNIPLERVVQLHVAGHTHYPEGIVDTHGNPICTEVWDLLRWTLENSNPCGVLLERDLNLPEFEALAEELAQIHQIWDSTQMKIQTQASATPQEVLQ